MRPSHAFTLIELLVAIAMIATLAAAVLAFTRTRAANAAHSRPSAGRATYTGATPKARPPPNGGGLAAFLDTKRPPNWRSYLYRNYKLF